MKVKSIEIILKVVCTNCGHSNYINKGDYHDCSIGQDEAVECWFCNDREWFCEDIQTLNEVDLFFHKGLKRL